jgi:homoserine kinase type II
MAQLTRLDDGAAQQIASALGLELESWQALPAHGTVNSNFRLRASGETWFLRVNEGKREADVRAEAQLVALLAARGVPTPEARGVVPFGEKWVTLFPFIDAREARALDDVEAAGEALGRLHAARLDGGELKNHYTLDELERRLEGFSRDARFAEIVPKLARELGAARRRERGAEGLIHQDLFPDNVLVGERGDLRALLDFEQATRGPLGYDVAVTLNAWCWDGATVRRDAAERLLAAYARTFGALPSIGELAEECRLAAARFTITRITDVFLAANVDEDLRRRKDWRDYARRLEYWETA